MGLQSAETLLLQPYASARAMRSFVNAAGGTCFRFSRHIWRSSSMFIAAMRASSASRSLGSGRLAARRREGDRSSDQPRAGGDIPRSDRAMLQARAGSVRLQIHSCAAPSAPPVSYAAASQSP